MHLKLQLNVKGKGLYLVFTCILRRRRITGRGIGSVVEFAVKFARVKILQKLK